MKSPFLNLYEKVYKIEIIIKFEGYMEERYG